MNKTHEDSITSSTYTLWCICALPRLQGPCFLRLTNLVMESLSVLGRFSVRGTFEAMVTDTRGCGRLEFALWGASKHCPDQSSNKTDDEKALLAVHSAVKSEYQQRIM